MDISKFKSRILEILRSSDLDTITTKSVRKILQKETRESLDDYKKPLNSLIMQCLDEVNRQTEIEEDGEEEGEVSSHHNNTNHSLALPKIKKSSSSTITKVLPSKSLSSSTKSTKTKKRSSELIDSDDDDNNSISKSKSTTKKRKKTPKKRNIDDATLQKNPFTKSWLLSSSLSEVIGVKTSSRPGVVKALWAYIKENNLQDPTNKQYILCDNKLKGIFEGEEKMHCFTMNKHIGKHLSNLPEGYLEQKE